MMRSRVAEWAIEPSVSPSEYGVTIVDERGEIVASTYEEHAALLRAAPALLAALRAVEHAFAVGEPSDGYGSEMDSAAKLIRSAIAAAVPPAPLPAR